MKNVIVYGIRNIEMRKNISFFLDNQYKIIGYMDSNYHEDRVGGESFIQLTELSEIEYDLILLASFRTNTLCEMRRTLLTLKVPEEKIITPTMFLQQDAEKCQLDIITDIEKHYENESGLMFGLSYSLWDIRKKELHIPFYDCSWHGLDMYYNFRICQYMACHGYLSHAKTALLVFPYYYFNYDMSRSMYHYKTGQIFSVLGLNDWHNYKQMPGAHDYVENYKMFGRKVADFYCSRRYEMESKHIFQESDGVSSLERIWFAHYEATIRENKDIFFEFLAELMRRNITPVIVITPLFLNGMNLDSKAAFQRKKEEFYQIVHETERKLGTIQVIDYADMFSDKRECFFDLTHLNSYGAKHFTHMLDKALLELR